MSELNFDFRSLEFRKTTHDAMRPPVFDGDFTRGEDYGAGQLLSVQHAKKARALSFVVRFTAGRDASAAGWGRDESGDVEFLVLEKQGRFLGTITRQSPLGFCFLERDDFVILDCFGPGLDEGGRQQLHFFCKRHLSKLQGLATLSVTVYIRKGWFGGWKEVLVKVPKKDLYVALL